MGTTITADMLFASMLPSMAQYDSISAGALGSGIDKLTAGDYATAVREFRRCIALSPYSNNALSAFEYMANAFTRSGKTSDAMQACRQAISVFPSADGMNLKLGNLLYSQGNYTEAVVEYKAAVTKNPTSNQNVYSLGEGYLAKGSYADAEAQFKRSIQLAPKDSGGYYGLGKTYERMGRLNEAQEQLKKALAIKPGLSDAHYELGMIYAEQRETRKVDSELAILSEQSLELYAQLRAQIDKTSNPRLIAAYAATNLNLAASAGTQVSTIDSALATAGATKNFTVNFIFDKEMDTASVLNVLNWNISRSTRVATGGLYNWGMALSETEVKVAPMPVNVTYDSSRLTAKVTFSITQNDTGDGTIDLSHLVFKFKGTDGYGNTMDAAADEYNSISRIV